MTNQYAERDAEALEPHYTKHLEALDYEYDFPITHFESLAAELAVRDQEIERLDRA